MCLRDSDEREQCLWYHGNLSCVPSSSIQVGLIVVVLVILIKCIWKEQASSQYSIFFFFFGPKGEECISGLSFVSNAYCRLTALPEQLS